MAAGFALYTTFDSLCGESSVTTMVLLLLLIIILSVGVVHVESFLPHRPSALPPPRSVVTRAKASCSDRLTSEFQEQWIDSGVMSGATVLITRADHVVYRHEFGTHQAESERVCNVFSMTKLVTSIAILQLEEQGLLSLDEPVSRHLASFRGREHYEKITLRQVLSHRAGFSYMNGLVNPSGSICESYRWMWAFGTNNLRGYVDNYLAKQPLLFTPGTSFNYADGANVAAAVVEEVSGMPFADYVRDRITSPLGMNDTTFVASSEQRSRYPITRFDLDTVSHPVVPFLAPFRALYRLGIRTLEYPRALADPILNDRCVRGDMGLKTCASDWSKLVQMLLSDGEVQGGAPGGEGATQQILTPHSIDVIGSSTLPAGETLIAPFALDAAPESAEGKFGMSKKDWPNIEDGTFRAANSFQGQAPGLGVNVILDAPTAGLDVRATGTCWWMGIASTFFSYHRDAGIGCIVLAQEVTYFSRMGALAHVIGAAHDLCEDAGDESTSDGTKEKGVNQ